MSEFKVTPSAVPGRAPRGGRSIYKEIIEDFVKQDIPSGLIEVKGRKPATVYVQLRKAASTSEAKVTVVQRAGQVYLVRQ